MNQRLINLYSLCTILIGCSEAQDGYHYNRPTGKPFLPASDNQIIHANNRPVQEPIDNQFSSAATPSQQSQVFMLPQLFKPRNDIYILASNSASPLFDNTQSSTTRRLPDFKTPTNQFRSGAIIPSTEIVGAISYRSNGNLYEGQLNNQNINNFKSNIVENLKFQERPTGFSATSTLNTVTERQQQYNDLNFGIHNSEIFNPKNVKDKSLDNTQYNIFTTRIISTHNAGIQESARSGEPYYDEISQFQDASSLRLGGVTDKTNNDSERCCPTLQPNNVNGGNTDETWSNIPGPQKIKGFENEIFHRRPPTPFSRNIVNNDKFINIFGIRDKTDFRTRTSGNLWSVNEHGKKVGWQEPANSIGESFVNQNTRNLQTESYTDSKSNTTHNESPGFQKFIENNTKFESFSKSSELSSRFRDEKRNTENYSMKQKILNTSNDNAETRNSSGIERNITVEESKVQDLKNDGLNPNRNFFIELNPSEVHYPNLSEIPASKFQCNYQTHPGYYADAETFCQVFHICANGVKYDFLCPNGTVFHQRFFICIWWHQFDCSTAESLYNLPENFLDNDKIGSLIAHAAGATGARGPGAIYSPQKLPLSQLFQSDILSESKTSSVNLSQPIDSKEYLAENKIISIDPSINTDTPSDPAPSLTYFRSHKMNGQLGTHRNISSSQELSNKLVSDIGSNHFSASSTSETLVPNLPPTTESSRPSFNLHGHVISYRPPFESQNYDHLKVVDELPGLISALGIQKPLVAYKPSFEFQYSLPSIKPLSNIQGSTFNSGSILGLRGSDISTGFVPNFSSPVTNNEVARNVLWKSSESIENLQVPRELSSLDFDKFLSSPTTPQPQSLSDSSSSATGLHQSSNNLESILFNSQDTSTNKLPFNTSKPFFSSRASQIPQKPLHIFDQPSNPLHMTTGPSFNYESPANTDSSLLLGIPNHVSPSSQSLSISSGPQYNQQESRLGSEQVIPAPSSDMDQQLSFSSAVSSDPLTSWSSSSSAQESRDQATLSHNRIKFTNSSSLSTSSLLVSNVSLGFFQALLSKYKIPVSDGNDEVRLIGTNDQSNFSDQKHHTDIFQLKLNNKNNSIAYENSSISYENSDLQTSADSVDSLPHQKPSMNSLFGSLNTEVLTSANNSDLSSFFPSNSEVEFSSTKSNTFFTKNN